MASLISRLQRRYILEGDTLAQDAEICIGELMVALRKIVDMHADEYYLEDARNVAENALAKCAEG